MRLRNLTGHPVSFLLNDERYVLQSEVARPPRIGIRTFPAGEVSVEATQGVIIVPVVRSELAQHVVGLPEPAIDDGYPCPYCGQLGCGDHNRIRNCDTAPRYLVPRMLVNALPRRSDLVAPHALVREKGHVIGCRAVSKA